MSRDPGPPPSSKPPARNLLTSSFKDAVATIRRTGVEHQYQLVVTRAYEEGEEQLLEEDAESESQPRTRASGHSRIPPPWSALTSPADDERVFLIDQALGFRFGSLDGDATFAWRDLSGDDGDLWEFVSNKTVGNATSKLFEVTLLQCVYERVSCLILLH